MAMTACLLFPPPGPEVRVRLGAQIRNVAGCQALKAIGTGLRDDAALKARVGLAYEFGKMDANGAELSLVLLELEGEVTANNCARLAYEALNRLMRAFGALVDELDVIEVVALRGHPDACRLARNPTPPSPSSA